VSCDGMGWDGMGWVIGDGENLEDLACEGGLGVTRGTREYSSGIGAVAPILPGGS
jgi:hypothetical protein